MNADNTSGLRDALDFVNRQPCRCMSIAQLGERDYCDRCQSTKNLRALLARTEAGADHGAADHGMDRATKESLVPCDCGCGRSCCAFCGTDIGFVTHPQDASGNADVAVAALREIYETGMYPEGHTLAGEHAYKGEYHADCIGIAERALAAMQAKEGAKQERDDA